MFRLASPASYCMIFVALAFCVADRSEGAATVRAEAKSRGGEPATAPPEAASATRHRARRLVFSCFAGGIVVFSDRPCGPTATSRELRIDAPSDRGGRAVSLAPERSPVSARAAPLASADANPVDTHTGASTCQRLQAAVDALAAHMRNGYSAKEAGRLWDRWREARARLREAHC